MGKPNRKIHAGARGALTIAASALMLTLTTTADASGYTEKTLHSFCNETNCGDGDTPMAGLLMDDLGDLYGMTATGGKYDKGLVFKLIPNANKTKYTEHILHNFCANVNCPG